jgi:hypothetical protein
LLTDYIARPVLRVLAACDALERGWTSYLASGKSGNDDPVAPSAGSLKEVS